LRRRPDHIHFVIRLGGLQSKRDPNPSLKDDDLKMLSAWILSL